MLRVKKGLICKLPVALNRKCNTSCPYCNKLHCSRLDFDLPTEIFHPKKRVKISHVRTLIGRAEAKIMCQLGDIGEVSNPQVLEAKHKYEGQLFALDAVENALRGNDVFLKILAGE